MKSNNDHFLRNKIAELSELPKDVIMGMPVLTILGKNELCLENYRGIIEYTDSLVRIQTKTGQIRIFGKNLEFPFSHTRSPQFFHLHFQF